MVNLVAIITSAASAVGVPPALLLAVCFQESSLRNIHVPKDGRSASWGVCQLKLATARDIEPGIRPSHLMDPAINARIAAKYLARQLKRYHGNTWCAVDSYNRGHAARCHKNINTKYVRQVKKHMKRRPWQQKI